MLVKQQVGTELSYFLSQTEELKAKVEKIDINDCEIVDETLLLFNECSYRFDHSCIRQYLSEKTEIFVTFVVCDNLYRCVFKNVFTLSRITLTSNSNPTLFNY